MRKQERKTFLRFCVKHFYNRPLHRLFSIIHNKYALTFAALKQSKQ